MNTSTPRQLGGIGMWLALGVLAVGTAPALGQQQAGGDGRALDANQQVGGGGVNPGRIQPDFSLRNDIVTGNVGGGRAFRGDVDYTAPGEFRGDLGSDDLFQFRRDSLGGRPTGDLPRGTFDTGSVYRPFASPHTARPITRPGQAQAPWSIDGARPLSDAIDSRRLDQRRDTFDRVQLDRADGGWLELSVSPLLGMRSDVVGVDRVDQQRITPSIPDEDDLFDLREEDVEIDRSLRRSSQLDMRAYQQAAGLGTPDQDMYRSPRTAPTLMIGRQLRSQLLTQDRVGDHADDRLQRLEDQIFSPIEADRSVEPGQDPYLDLLSAVRDQREERLQQLVRERDQAEDDDQARDPWDMPDLLRRHGEDADAEAPQRRGQLDEDPEDEHRTEELRQLRARAQELVESFDYDLPPLDTLAGRDESRTNQLLAEAEQHLSQGEFFDAEGRYREILARDDDAPLAQVGLVHAQLGAGMIRSAANNLRTLFEQHPELIAARYEANLLPPPDRLDWLEDELRRMVAMPRHAGGEAALMLAYLGYQRGDEAIVEEGLDLLLEHNEQDALEPVLRHIWLGPAE